MHILLIKIYTVIIIFLLEKCVHEVISLIDNFLLPGIDSRISMV